MLFSMPVACTAFLKYGQSFRWVHNRMAQRIKKLSSLLKNSVAGVIVGCYFINLKVRLHA